MKGISKTATLRKQFTGKSKKSISGSSAGPDIELYAKELEGRITEMEGAFEDFKEALTEKLDKGDYAVLASDKVTK